MNKVAKGFLLAFGAVAALLLLILLGVNLYVESTVVQARLETELTRTLRMPVELARVRFSFWKGLRIEGLRVPVPDGEPFLTAPEVSARLDWRALLSRRLVVRELLIQSPSVVWEQNRKGKWVLPKSKKPKAEKPEEKEEPKTPEPEPEPEEAGPKKKIEFRIVAARMENATFRFLDRGGNPLAVFEGVDVGLPTASVGEAHGEARIARLVLQERLLVESISTPFSFVDGRLELPKIEARLAGGTLRGAYRLQPLEDDAPFTLDVVFEEIDLHTLLSQAAPEESGRRSEGKLGGSLDLYGESGQKKSIAGVGQAFLRGGRMEQQPLFQMLGQALQIDELTRLELHEAQLDCRVGQGRVYIDRLVAESQNLNLQAEGDVRFDGRLDLDAGLFIGPKVLRQLPGWIKANFRPAEGSEDRVLKFAITGTLKKPETDLMRVLVGERLERQVFDLYNTLRGATGGKKKKKERAKPPKAAPETAAPAPSAHGEEMPAAAGVE